MENEDFRKNDAVSDQGVEQSIIHSDKEAENKKRPFQEPATAARPHEGAQAEAVKPSRARPRKTRFVWQFGAIGVLLVGVAVAALCCSRQDNRNDGAMPKLELPSGPDYSILTQNWNQFAEAYPARFMLMGDRAVNPEAIVESLKNWCAAFQQPLDPDEANALASLERDYGITTFNKWEEFRQRHRKTAPLHIDAEMEPARLATALNAYAGIIRDGRTPDYITPDTVKTIVEMNSLCAFFEQEKEKLHNLKIDTRIHTCQGLSTKGNYPMLDMLLE